MGDGVLASDFEEQLESIDKEKKIGWQEVKTGLHEAVIYICCLNQMCTSMRKEKEYI